MIDRGSSKFLFQSDLELLVAFYKKAPVIVNDDIFESLKEEGSDLIGLISVSDALRQEKIEKKSDDSGGSSDFTL